MAEEIPPGARNGWSKEIKLKLLNTAVIGGIVGYGVMYWHYGETSPQVVDEDWFEHDSAHGGADKLGHAISTYYAVMAYSWLYDRWGYEPAQSALYGALSAWSTFCMIEVGDAFSRHGFSVEDLVMDSAGAVVGYLHRRIPGFRARVDFRVEYWPSYGARKGTDIDYVSDYSGYKYLVALKGDGIEALSSTWLRFCELQLGYYTRGYQSQDEDYYGDPYRVLYAAVGVNLSHIFHKHNWNKTAAFLHYYQVPCTYAPLEYNLDD
ncbi:MAG TPA: DUF2279 domain-containing protein [Kiritimatiellia bacterium]|nr:DUF2279 domain-containing protein [Lentisphaerota bacterium]HOU21246.1 DUF2279 domain-containing protein [Kiritimatiellia bacterium]HQQ60704.1 DUF2279 domain-containing protein [Kiritimatiellia bacterium]